MKYMKIVIDANQTLDAVISEIERLGYMRVGIITKFTSGQTFIVTTHSGYYTTLMRLRSNDTLTTLTTLTTLDELRGM